MVEIDEFAVFLLLIFISKDDIIVHYEFMTTPHSGFLPTPIRMTLNDPERPIQLKARFLDGTRDVCLLAF